MIGYVTLGTNDLEKAEAYYDELLAEMSAAQLIKEEREVIWGVAPGQPMLCLIKPFNGEQATVGNGVMVALSVENKSVVDAVYNKAMALGSPSEGELGERGDDIQVYGGYFRDPDGNKLFVYCMLA